MKYKAVVFDLDGTLVNSLEDLADSTNHALTEMGYDTHPLESFKYFVGNGVVMLGYRALPEHARDDETVRKCVEMSLEEYGRRWDKKTRPYDGMPELLNELVARGIKLAVLSNKGQEFTTKVVDKILADWKFEEVWGVSETVPPKPDPTGALNIAKAMGVKPEECLYLGDTSTDMETANGSGMYAIGALWGFRTAEELAANGAATLLSNPQDMIQILDGLR